MANKRAAKPNVGKVLIKNIVWTDTVRYREEEKDEQ